MTVELKVPSVGESITEVTIDSWLKNEGDAIERDNPVAVIESEKATVELPAEASGTLTKILKRPGDTAHVGETIAIIDTEARPTASAAQAAAPKPAEARKSKPAAAPPPPVPAAPSPKAPRAPEPSPITAKPPPPAAQEQEPEPSAAAAAATPIPPAVDEEIVPMTRLRKTIARRLVEVQQTTAMLTTFNEVDMSAVIGLRKQHGEAFQQKHGVKLGFMSFFVKAAIDALKLVPQVNAEIRDENIVFKNHYDIAIAVRRMVYLALTYDHRIVDGADAARFLSDVKQRLETGTFEV